MLAAVAAPPALSEVETALRQFGCEVELTATPFAPDRYFAKRGLRSFPLGTDLDAPVASRVFRALCDRMNIPKSYVRRAIAGEDMRQEWATYVAAHPEAADGAGDGPAQAEKDPPFDN